MLGIFITAAYPSEDACIKALKILHEEKVSLIEFGIPFSDPLADGPIIQNASFKALANGINIDKVFDLVAQARSEAGLDVKFFDNEPQKGENSEVKINTQSHYGLSNIIFFTYYNPVYVYGIEKLAQKCSKYGIKGLLIPDLPVEEAETVSKILKNHGLTLTLLVAITSSEQRIKKIVELSEPFIYLVSRIGITGSDSDTSKWQETRSILKQKIAEIRKYAPNKPIGLGFGIDSASKVEETFGLGVEIAIIGTKAIRVLEEDRSHDLAVFRDFIQSLNISKIGV
ncbi:MAG: tryptophan synthase subunit alpha [bacterium]